jgi:hypothetical protein
MSRYAVIMPATGEESAGGILGEKSSGKPRGDCAERCKMQATTNAAMQFANNVESSAL